VNNKKGIKKNNLHNQHLISSSQRFFLNSGAALLHCDIVPNFAYNEEFFTRTPFLRACPNCTHSYKQMLHQNVGTQQQSHQRSPVRLHPYWNVKTKLDSSICKRSFNTGSTLPEAEASFQQVAAFSFPGAWIQKKERDQGASVSRSSKRPP
jgi:hypothetical protein